MKSKTLVAMAVASTFGWSAAAFAGAGHEVVTPFSPNESGDPMLTQEQLFGSSHPSSIGATSHESSGMITGSYSDSNSFSSDQTASLSTDESLAAANEGVYSDYYVVSWSPVAVESWDYYLIDDSGSEQIALIDVSDAWMPTHELALVQSPDDEMIYELVLLPTSYDDMFAEFSSDFSDEAAGE